MKHGSKKVSSGSVFHPCSIRGLIWLRPKAALVHAEPAARSAATGHPAQLTVATESESSMVTLTLAGLGPSLFASVPGSGLNKLVDRMAHSGSPASNLRDRLASSYDHARSVLLAGRNSRGFWEGELSTSALATATAVMALEMVRRQS